MRSLALSIEPDPWSLSFGVLDPAAPTGFVCDPRSEVGAFRVEVADPPPADRYRVTRVRERCSADDGTFSAVLDTDHPDGLTARVDIRHGDDGTVSVAVGVEGATAIGQSFIAHSGERFLGFGERSHAVSLERGVVENYVGEGPYQPHEYPLLAQTVPAWGIRNRLDATYYPLPWVLSTRGYGLSIDQDYLSLVRIRTESPDRWSIEAEASRLTYTVYPGPTPLDALRRYTAATGRQPAPERWFFGPWYQSGHANHVPLGEERRQLDALTGALDDRRPAERDHEPLLTPGEEGAGLAGCELDDAQPAARPPGRLRRHHDAVEVVGAAPVGKVQRGDRRRRAPDRRQRVRRVAGHAGEEDIRCRVHCPRPDRCGNLR